MKPNWSQKNIYNYSNIINASHNDLKSLINQSESNLKKQLINTSNDIANFKNGVKIIYVAGPSCAGKTTFTKMLCDKLVVKDIQPIMISLDNFFLDRKDTPTLEDGITPDFESLRGLNIKLLKKTFANLKKNKVAFFPRFDFKDGVSIPEDHKIEINDNSVLIIEGIHALNPVINKAIAFSNPYKIFIEPVSNFVYKNQIIISGQQLRFMRRIIRDRVTRGNSPKITYNTWPKVLAGEVLYIQPYKYTADKIIDTTHPYEIALYKNYLSSILGSMKYSSEALYLQWAMKEIKGCTKKVIPDFSLLWEWIE